MKVDIAHREITKGFLSKKTYSAVDLTVTFSEEEKAIISEHKLTKLVILERDLPADEPPGKFKGIEDVWHLSVYKLLKGMDSYILNSPVDAKMYEDDLKEALVQLKGFMTANTVSNEDTSFEL